MIRRSHRWHLASLTLLLGAWGCAGLSMKPLPTTSLFHRDASLATGEDFERQQRWVEARHAYWQFVQQHPESADGWHRLAVVSTALGDHALAAQSFNRALDLSPHHGELLADAGYACYVRGEYQAAEPLLQLALQVQPADARAANNLGLVQGMTGRTADALATFERVQPRPAALKNLAYVHARRGEADRAYACYVEARQLDPSVTIPVQLAHRFANLEQPVAPVAAAADISTTPVTNELAFAIPPSPALPLVTASLPIITEPVVPEPGELQPATNEVAAESPVEAVPFVIPVQHETPVGNSRPAADPIPVQNHWRPTVVSPQIEPRPAPVETPVTEVTPDVPEVAALPPAVAAPVEPVQVIAPPPVPAEPQTWTIDVTPAIPAAKSLPDSAVTTRHQFTSQPAVQSLSITPAVQWSPQPPTVAPVVEASREEPVVTAPFEEEVTSDTAPAEASETPANDADDSVPEEETSAATVEPEREVVTILPRSLESLGLSEVCLVTLLEDKEIVRGSPDFQATYESENYSFATAAAAARFRENPRRFRPVAGGHDLVGLKSGEVIERGSLHHAAWYRQRLYLFTTDAHLQSFAETPQSYLLDPAGVAQASSSPDAISTADAN